MTDASVTELLKKLHETLGGTTAPSAISADDRKLLEQLSNDIQKLLGQEAAGNEPRSLAEQLQAAITRFEVTHPDLTATMSRAAKTLGDMGI